MTILNAVEGAVPSQIKTSMHFLRPSILFESEKPYLFRFPVQDLDIPQTNTIMDKHDLFPICNIRGMENSFSFERNGFTILTLTERLEYNDYFNDAGLARYFRALENLLRLHLKAARVEYFRHGV